MTMLDKGKDSLISRPSTLRRRPGNKAGNEAAIGKESVNMMLTLFTLSIAVCVVK